MSDYRRKHRRENYGHGGPRMWRPRQSLPLPAWEKQFCVRVGAIPWRRFIQAKNNVYPMDKVYKWDDSTGKEAFDEAKQRFWADLNGLPYKKRLPTADLYVDNNIDWNPKINPELLAGMTSAYESEGKKVAGINEWFSLPLDQIKPTGWD